MRITHKMCLTTYIYISYNISFYNLGHMGHVAALIMSHMNSLQPGLWEDYRTNNETITPSSKTRTAAAMTTNTIIRLVCKSCCTTVTYHMTSWDCIPVKSAEHSLAGNIWYFYHTNFHVFAFTFSHIILIVFLVKLKKNTIIRLMILPPPILLRTMAIVPSTLIPFGFSMARV